MLQREMLLYSFISLTQHWPTATCSVHCSIVSFVFMQVGCFVAQEGRHLFRYPLLLAVCGLIDVLALAFAHTVMHFVSLSALSDYGACLAS
jgi:accessory gene regulator protein AgrB